MQSVLNPGDEVLIADPSWATHSNMAIMLRGNVIRVPAPADNGFIPLFESWEKALTSKTCVIVLNYPANPTGAYPTCEYLQKLNDFAAAAEARGFHAFHGSEVPYTFGHVGKGAVFPPNWPLSEGPKRKPFRTR